VSPQPSDPGSKPRPLEQRRERLTIPPCPKCQSKRTVVASRTEYFVYFRSADCGEAWSTPKPGHEPA
jgi:hypothetical protein